MFIGFYVGDLTFGVMCVVGNDFLLMYFLCIFMYSVCLWLFFFSVRGLLHNGRIYLIPASESMIQFVRYEVLDGFPFYVPAALRYGSQIIKGFLNSKKASSGVLEEPSCDFVPALG